MCEQLVQGRTRQCSGWDTTRDFQSQVQRPNHYATEPQCIIVSVMLQQFKLNCLWTCIKFCSGKICFFIVTTFCTCLQRKVSISYVWLCQTCSIAILHLWCFVCVCVFMSLWSLRHFLYVLLPIK